MQIVKIFVFFLLVFLKNSINGAADDTDTESMADQTVIETLEQDLNKIADKRLKDKDKPSLNFDKDEEKHMKVKNLEQGHQVVINSDVSQEIVAGDGDLGSTQGDIAVKTVKVVIFPNGQKVEKVIDQGVIDCRNQTNASTCLEKYFEQDTSGLAIRSAAAVTILMITISAFLVCLTEFV